MEQLKTFFGNMWHTQIVSSIIVILVGIIIYRIIVKFLAISENKSKSKLFTSNKGKTYINLIKNIIRYIFIIITLLVLLQINGVNVSSVLAGVGVLGVVFGLAIQDWLKDIIRGSSILSDDYFNVGDVVKYKDIEGKVLVIGLKTTKIQDLATSNIISIANRNIEEIEVVSNYIYVRVPMPYEIDIEKAEKAVEDIIEIAEKYETIEKGRYLGVTEFKDSSTEYLLEMTCDPVRKLQAKRDTLRAIKVGLAENQIEIPYTQIDIHEK